MIYELINGWTTPHHFIRETLIGGIGAICNLNPYLSFALMDIGIEFLGKCLNTKQQPWHKGTPKEDFENAIKGIKALKKYEPYLSEFRIWDSLRNGFGHSLLPKPPISLSSLPNEAAHETKSHNGKILNLKNPEFYADFKLACEEVLQMTFDSNDKMNKPILFVPDYTDMGFNSSGVATY